MQMVPVKGSAFQDMPLVSNVEITEMRERCGIHLTQMRHCRQCRADAIGCLEEDVSALFSGPHESKPQDDSLETLRLAVASRGGVLVDQHFGQATDFYIYEYQKRELRFLQRRSVPGTGASLCDGKGGAKQSGEGRIAGVIETVRDCDGVLVMRMGASPKSMLEMMGIFVHETYGTIEDEVREAVGKIVAARFATAPSPEEN
jgi:predicted Fe-Mo cluster-binding NifX family protein